MTRIKLLTGIAGCLFCLAAHTAQARDEIGLPDYYVEGSFQIAAAQMISNLCPRLQLKKGLADLFQFSLSGQLKKDNALPPNVKESDQSFKLSLVIDKRFSGRLIALFEKYQIDPNAKADSRSPEVQAKFCSMGTGEISDETTVGKFIEASSE